MNLVTGGTGLVGSHVLYYLVCQDKPVRAIYRTEKKRDIVKRVFSYYSKNHLDLYEKIEWVEADLLDVPKLTKAFQAVDCVYHCAAYVSFDPDDYQKLRKTNIEGTANIVNICLSKKVSKLCYVSSIATIGEATDSSEITEETAWNPEADNSVYAITKYGAEMEVWRGTQEGLDAVIVNPGVIIGAGIWRHGSGHIFKQIHKGLSLYTNGNVACVDVCDVVSCMIELVESSTKNERFIIISENLKYQDFLSHIANSLQVSPPTKVAKPWLLHILWRLDWLRHKITGKRRKLVKQMVYALYTQSNYNNTKIKETLGFEFKPMKKSIKDVSKLFLKDF